MLSRSAMSDSYVTPVDCSPSGSSVHGILQARILEWVAISYSRGSHENRGFKEVTKAGSFDTFQTKKLHIFEELTRRKGFGLG